MKEPSTSSTIRGEVQHRVRRIRSIGEVAAAAWDGLGHGASPFLKAGFLAALEVSGSIGARAGWDPVYALVEGPGGALRGAVATFIKSHSYGEYIFDFGWARAAEQAGLDYFPKLVVAAPATPATGPRILLAPDADPGEAAAITAVLIGEVRAIADAAGCSSIHWLFCTAAEQATLAAAGYAARASYQFHFANPGYRDFDGFLGALKSRKRKQVRKERAKVAASIDGLRWIPARELDATRLADLERFYRTTVDEHHGRAYLRPGFFAALAQHLPDETWLVEATQGGARIAGALFLETAGALYGRYWGADREVELLHFEVAYYAGIERCIARGLPLFEAGAQGEHKLVRGFLPAATYSAHWIREPALFDAIRAFCRREAAGVAAEMAQLAPYAPYREGSDDDS